MRHTRRPPSPNTSPPPPPFSPAALPFPLCAAMGTANWLLSMLVLCSVGGRGPRRSCLPTSPRSLPWTSTCAWASPASPPTHARWGKGKPPTHMRIFVSCPSWPTPPSLLPFRSLAASCGPSASTRNGILTSQSPSPGWRPPWAQVCNWRRLPPRLWRALSVDVSALPCTFAVCRTAALHPVVEPAPLWRRPPRRRLRCKEKPPWPCFLLPLWTLATVVAAVTAAV